MGTDTVVMLDRLNQKEALRYLGYKGAVPDDRTQKLIEDCENRLLDAARPQFVYRCFDIEKNSDGIAVRGTNLILTGNSIREHLDGCSRAVLLCATISSDVDRLLRVTQIEDMAAMIVMDSLASVAVEQVCNKAEKIIAASLEESYLTWRFGIGYGDLPLSLQDEFVRALDATRRIGVCVTKSSLLTPRKSVTCILGVSDKPLAKRQRGCATCTMRDRCTYRASGGSCNGQ